MAGPIRIAILANGRQARSEAALTARAYAGMGRTVGRLGGVLAGVFAVRELARAGAAVIKVGSDYVDSLNKIQALTGANDATMTRAAQTLEKNAGLYAKMGQTTGDAAGGVVELTKSGLSLDKALRAVNSTMVLAKAGELSVADASTFVANTLNTFSLKASQAGKIANGLANAANISSADVTDLAESFKYVAPLAAKAGVSLNQTDAILAELSNSGIKASQAGTSFRTFLLSLQAPSAAANVWLGEMGVSLYDVQGNMKPLPRIIDDLRGGISKLSVEDQNFALKSIFGKTGVTGAQVILKNGTEGLAEYTKGVQRAGAAQKLAIAASQGLMGTLKSLKSSAISTAQSLYRQFSPKLNAPLQELAGWLAKNQDELIQTGIAAAEKAGPALKSLAELTLSVASAVKDTTLPLAGDLLPALTTVASVAKTAADAFNSLPDPVKQIAVQAGLAALVLPRLSAGVTSVTTSVGANIARLKQFNAEMTYTATRTQATSAAMAKLSSAARTAAGVGGLVALTQASKASSDKMKILGDTAGGAMLGFSVGGPWGAAIGAGVGALAGLVRSVDNTSQQFGIGKKDVSDYASSLNQVSGAATEATRKLVYLDLQQSGAIKSGRNLGISSRDLVGDLLGNAAAHQRVAAAMRKVNFEGSLAVSGNTRLHGVVAGQSADLLTLKNALGVVGGKLAEETAKTRAQALATENLHKVFKGLPKKVITSIQTKGIPDTKHEIVDLTKRFKLTPKQIRTVIKATGTDTTVKQVQKVIAKLQEADKTKVTLPKVQSGVKAGLAQAERIASVGASRTIDRLEAELAKGKADMPKLKPSLATLIGGTTTQAGSGGRQIGGALKGGILGGFAGTAAALAAQARAAVSQAVNAAKAQAKIYSPSHVMRDEVGAMLGKGLVQGVEGQKSAAAQAGRDLIDSLTKGAKGGLDGIRRVIEGLRNFLEKSQDKALKEIEKAHDRTWAAIEKDLKKRFKGKELAHQLAERKKELDRKLAAEKKAWRAHTAAVNALIKSQRTALIANGRAQDALTAKIQKTRQTYRDLIQAAKDYAASIKATILATGDITQLGKNPETGAVSLSALLDQLKAKAAQARAFADVILRLRNLGLNETNINQLLNEGPDSLATAQAIAAGGAAAIDEINQLTGQLASTGAVLGDQMAKTYYAAGIRAAEGLLEGLKKKRKELEEIAQILAESLVKAIKKALGIKSPSTVFRDLGAQAVKGLAIGLDETYVTRQGAGLAKALQSGFGTPSLTAFQSINGTDQASTADVVAAIDTMRAELSTRLAAVETAAGVTGPSRAGQEFGSALNERAANRSRKG